MSLEEFISLKGNMEGLPHEPGAWRISLEQPIERIILFFAFAQANTNFNRLIVSLFIKL